MTVYYATTAVVVAISLLAQASTRRLGARSTGTSQDGDAPAASTRRSVAPWGALLVGAVLSAVGALRWRVGTDYAAYEWLYDSYKVFPWREYSLTNEPGLRFMAKMSSLVVDDSAAMFAVAAVFTTGLAVWTIYRSSPSFALGILLYILTGPWLGSFNGMRQYLAAVVVFAGHRLILERRFVPYLAVVVLAGLFHVSAFVLILLYFLPRRPLGLGTAVLAVVAGVVATNLYGRFLDVVTVFREGPGLSDTNAYFTEQVSLLRIAVAIAPLVYYAVVTDKTALRPRDHFYVHVLVVNAMLLIAASGSAYVARFAIYTGIFLCLAIPRLLPTNDSRARTLAVLVIVPLYFMFWYVETSGSTALTTFRWITERGG